MVSLFASRWKRYAPWTVVVWHRLFGHGKQRHGFYSGPDRRCPTCGDKLFGPDPFGPIENVGYQRPTPNTDYQP